VVSLVLGARRRRRRRRRSGGALFAIKNVQEDDRERDGVGELG